jgi:poly(3-hydroxybutyrate) depolymerase
MKRTAPASFLPTIVLGLACLAAAGTALAARSWPDSSARIVPFADQFPSSLSATQRWFAATHFAGTQKMRRSDIQAIRVYNTNFLCLHYQLAVGCGPELFLDGNDWVSDWSHVNAQTNWFLLNESGQRVHQTLWNWDLMDVRYTSGTPVNGLPAYWISNCLARIRNGEDDGVFADSFTPDAYGFGQSNPTHTWIEDVDGCLTNWVPHLESFGRACRDALAAAPEGFVYLPNLGALVTGWLDMDYGLGHGGMIEGFAFWEPGNYLDPADWQLQMNRALDLARSNKIVICQSYPGAGDATERMFATGSYLLVKGTATYLNLLSTDAVALEYYPEYTLDLGAPVGGLPADMDACWEAAWGVFRRDYTNGIVLVNPGDSAVAIPNLGRTWWRALTSGGGPVNAAGSYGGTVIRAAVTNLTLPAHSAAVLFTSGGGSSTNNAPLQPVSLHAVHRSGQTFVTWDERADLADESYRIYRHTAPITANTLAAATLLYQVWEGSADFHANRYWDDNTGSMQARYLERLVITNGGAQLPAGTGLLVWTLATNDFAGGATGAVYYAVTTVNSDGVENRTNFTSANVIGPVAEGVAEPLAVETTVSIGRRGHLYLQFMDLRNWNPTFHAPHPGNGYLGLNPDLASVQHALAYAYDYAVYDPECSDSPAAAFFSLHGWGGNTYGPLESDPNAYDWCAYKIYPVDQSETWYFGFAKNHDYRQPGEVAAGDTIVNFTEQRLLQMLRSLQRNPPAAPLDPDRVYVYGQSMGGSGTLALALRYPNVFAAAYASEPMTDYASAGDGGGLDWRSDIEPKWGERSLNLPVTLDGPAGWADHLKPHNGTSVWAWQNHRRTTTNRLADDFVPFGVGHGTNDMVIEWPTQAQPFYGPLDASRHCYGGVVNDAGHSWLGFWGAPPTLEPDGSLTPFRGFRVVLHETVPGLSRGSANPASPPTRTGDYNLALDWSASWTPWDGAPLDTATVWQMSLRSLAPTNQTVDVTPRRTQAFRVAPGAAATWQNLRVSDGMAIQSGSLTADAHGLLTVTNVVVSPDGNRVRLELTVVQQPRFTRVSRQGPDLHLTFTTTSNHTYHIERSLVLPASSWSDLSGSLLATSTNVTWIHANGMTNAAGFYRVRMD